MWLLSAKKNVIAPLNFVGIIKVLVTLAFDCFRLKCLCCLKIVAFKSAQHGHVFVVYFRALVSVDAVSANEDGLAPTNFEDI